MIHVSPHQIEKSFSPLVFGNRYFVMEQHAHGPSLVTVIGSYEKQPICEVFRNHPMETADTEVTKVDKTTLIARDRMTGKILYTVSGSKIGLYGLLYGDLEVVIDEIGIRIGDSTYPHNELNDGHESVEVFEDGQVKTGRAIPQLVRECWISNRNRLGPSISVP
jgi:hypothetical protein